MAGDLRLIVIPRYGVGKDADWYGWLEGKLKARNKFPLGEFVFCELRPEPSAPTIAASVKHLKEIMGDDEDALANTGLIGHSLGAQVALRAIAELEEGTRVAGVLAVAGWLKLDLSPNPLKEWLETKFDQKLAREHTKKLVNVISSNDPNQIDVVSITKQWKDGKLRADEIEISPRPGHVSEHEEPEVLEAAIKMFG